MAIDAQMYFKDYQGNFLASEAQLEFGTSQNTSIVTPFKEAFSTTKFMQGASGGKTGARRSGLFEIEDYSFDIEQVLSIGSQSSGSGAGKVTFNPFSITRKIDCSSPMFFSMACSGTPFAQVGLGLRKSAGALNTGGGSSGLMYLAFTFALVAVKTLAWAHDDEAPKETVTFEYGGLNIDYWQQAPDGSLVQAPQKGWNRVKNIAADTLDTLKIV